LGSATLAKRAAFDQSALRHRLVSAVSQHKVEFAARAESVRYVPLPRVLRWFWAGTTLAFGLTLLFAYLEFHAGWLKGRWDPLQYPLFWDLMEFYKTFRLVHTAAFYHSPVSAVSYPPFAAALFGMMYTLSHPVRVYLVIASVGLGVAIWGVRRELLQYGVRPSTAILFPLTLAVTSFPIARLVPQGNIELFLWIFAAAGVWAYLRGYDDAAAILWGLAAATKLYPVIFLVLFLPRREYRAFLVGVATFVAVSVGSLAYLGPTIPIAWKGSLADVFGYQGLRVAEWTIHDLAGNHSSFTLVKVAAMVERINPAALTMSYYLCGAVFFAAVFFGRVRKLPVVNQLLVVSLFMVMLPTISYYHTLVHLYPPWLLLVFLAIRAERAGVSIPGLNGMILLFFPLFISFTLFTFPTLLIYAGLIQSALLVWLFLKAVMVPFDEPVPLRKELHVS
jgi:hypothetical protein